MVSSEVRVLGARESPFALRARIALNIKGVEYEFIKENTLSPIKSDILLKSNPIHKKVPVLFYGDRDPICESIVIVQYIDEFWASGPSILPYDPYDRALARFWAAYIDSKLPLALLETLVSEGDDARKIAAQNEVAPVLVPLENAFTKCSKGGKFFGGDRIGYLDIALGCFLGWLSVMPRIANYSLINEERTPNLFKWAKHFADDVAVRDVLPSNDELEEFSKPLTYRLRTYGYQP